MKNNSQQIEKVVMDSLDIENENIQKIKAIFPQFVKDGSVDFDSIQAFLKKEGVLSGVEKYGLSWAGKSNAFRAIRTSATGTLSPQVKESKNWDSTENIFIEGDNLEVLKLLQKKYANPGKIKMIYIDPPYNTGKDFIYKDNFNQNVSDYYNQSGQSRDGIKLTSNLESNGRYHSDWLTMMYSRLFLARNLLRDDGIIFVSIDDNEMANLKMIMDEIFGEENYLNAFCWVNNLKGRQISGTGAAKTYEYVLAYTKNVGGTGIFEMSIDKLKVLMPSSYKGFNYETESDDGGDFVVKNELYNTNSAFNEETRPNLVYNIHYNFKTKEVRFSEISEKTIFDGFTKITPKKNNDGVHKFHAWRWSKTKIANETDDLKFVKTDDGAKIFTKIRAYNTTALKDLITDITTSVGSNEIKDLFDGKKYFDYPKPVDLIKVFVSQTEDEDIILDFFAGSGTTAHAVMDLNSEDGSNRKWICVQIPEEIDEKSEAYKAGYRNIAEISRERIRLAGNKIKKENKDKKGINELDFGFKALSLTSSNYRKWNTLTADDDENTLIKQSKLFIEKPLIDKYNEQSVVYEVLLK